MEHDGVYFHELDRGQALLFAVRLKTVFYRPKPATDMQNVTFRSYLRQHIDWLNAIHRLGSPLRIAYRIVARPSPASFARGQVEVGLLVRIDKDRAENDFAHPSDLARRVLNLLNGVFEAYEFQLLEDKASFLRFYRPFTVASVAEIRRREDRFLPKSSLPLTRLVDPFRSERKGTKDSVYFVYPFVPTTQSLERLFRFLLLQTQPCVIQTILEPTQLRTDEESLFVKQLQLCDKAAYQPHMQLFAGPSVLSASLARWLSRALLSQYLGLLDAPFLVQLVLAVPGKLTPELVHGVGVEFTEPAGGVELVPGIDEDLLSGQTGGFDVFLANKEEERKALTTALNRVETVRDWARTMARTEAEQRRLHMFDPVEAASLFRFPAPAAHSLPGLPVQIARVVPLPREFFQAKSMAAEPGRDAIVVGVNPVFGSAEPVTLLREDRREHVYIVGQTGTGKTSLIYSMILADLRNGDGVGLIDPHGDLFRMVLSSIPEGRGEDVVVFDPTDKDYPVALNPLSWSDELERDFIVQEMVTIARRIYEPLGQSNLTGPVFEDTVRTVLSAVMIAEQHATFAHFLSCLSNRWYRRYVVAQIEKMGAEEATAFLAKANLENLSGMRELSETVAYVASKYGRLLTNTLLRNITLQKETNIDFEDILDNRRILLVNLNRGQIGLLNAEWLGMFIMLRLQLAALRRAGKESAERRDFFLYIDEFQNVATDNFPELLGEARKFRLNLTLAHQYYTQVPPRVGEAIVGNVGTIVAFRVGAADAPALSGIFAPVFDAQDLANQPNYHAAVSSVRASKRIRPFTLRTFKPNPPDKVESSARLIRRSREKFASPRERVEQEISDLLKSLFPTSEI